MKFFVNKLKKFSYLFFQKNNFKKSDNEPFNYTFEKDEGLLGEGLLKELSPFYFEETSLYDEGTIDVLIKFKKSQRRKDL